MKKVTTTEFEGARRIVTTVLSLDERDKRIITMYADGFRAKEIASDLFLSNRTVETLTAAIRFMIGAKSIAHMVQLALKNSLL